MEKQNRIIGIVGHKGSGKSTVLAESLDRFSRVVIFDTAGEHEFAEQTFYDPEGLADFLDSVAEDEDFTVRFVPEKDKETSFAMVSDTVYDAGSITFVLEEAPCYMSAGWHPDEFDQIARLGRHRNVDVFWTSQRLATVSTHLRSATDEFVFFLQTAPADLRAVEEIASSEVAGEVIRLGRHNWIKYDVIERRIVARKTERESSALVRSKFHAAETNAA